LLIDNKIEKDFNLSGEEIEIMQLIKSKAEDINIPMALEPDILKQRLPSKEKTPLIRILSPILAAAAACFAVVVVGTQNLPQNTPPIFVDLPEISVSESSVAEEVSSAEVAEASKESNEVFTAQTEVSVEVKEDNLPVEDISSSVPEEYKAIYGKVRELDGKNPAQVKGVSRTSNFSAVFGNNNSLISAYQNDSESQFDTVQINKGYIYSVSDNNTVVISRADGNEFYVASEIFVDFGMPRDKKYDFENVTVTSCYVDQQRLIVLGTATYGDGGVVTAVATYDIYHPEKPVLLSNSYQDGILISSRIAGGFAYIVTRKSVVNPSEDDVETYIPFNMSNYKYKTLSAEAIHESDYAQSPCYIVASSLLIKEPYEFYDTIAVLGDSTELYIDESGIYLADNVYVDSIPYTAVVRIDYGKGNFDNVTTTSVSGRLFDSKSMNEYEDVIRLVTLRGDKYTLHTLDMNLDVISSNCDIASGIKLSDISFDRDKLYLFASNGKTRVYDLSDVYNPVENTNAEVSKVLGETVSINQDRAVGINVDDGLSLTLYDVVSTKRIREIETVVVDNGDIYCEASDNYDVMFIKDNLIGFSYYKYGDDGDTGSYYVLYSVEENSLVKKVEYRYPTKKYQQKADIRDNILYVTSPSSVAVIDINYGKVLWETEI